MYNERDDGTPKTRREKEIDRLRQLYNRRPQRDDGFDFQGVLLSDAIERCVKAFGLIDPFNPGNLKPACYKLTIGDEYAISGRIGYVSDEPGKNQIKIPSFEVAVIKTHETINMPRFLIGRWNIQVSRAYEGLLWVGGPQVDAGYVGNLFCPIYNLSDKDVTLYKGEPIAVIDFVKTTEFHDERSKQYQFPPDRVLFEEYKPQTVISGLAAHAKERLNTLDVRLTTGLKHTETQIRTAVDETDKQVESIQRRVDNFISVTFAAIAVLFAALAISVPGRESPSWQSTSVFLLSALAIFLAASAWLKSRSEGRFFGRAVQIGILLGIGAAFSFQLVSIRKQQNQINDLNKQLQELKAIRPQPPEVRSDSQQGSEPPSPKNQPPPHKIPKR